MSREPLTDAGTVEAPARKEPSAARERRFVYNNNQGGAGQNEYLTRGNRPIKRRRQSPFKIVSLIAGISLLIVFYVWNKITVNRVEKDIGQLEDRINLLEDNVKRIQADINRKSDLRRIEFLAKKNGMIYNPEPQRSFAIENYRRASESDSNR